MILQDKGQDKMDINRAVYPSMYLVYRILFTKQILGSIGNQLVLLWLLPTLLTLRSFISTLS